MNECDATDELGFGSRSSLTIFALRSSTPYYGSLRFPS